MPIVNGRYQAPTWVNNSSPAIDATELQAISDSIENVLSDEDIAKIWVWDKGTGTPSYVVNNDNNYVVSNKWLAMGVATTSTTITIIYYSSAVAYEGGGVVPSGANSVSGSYSNYSAFNVLKGKYIYMVANDESVHLYYIPSNATISTADSGSGSYRYAIKTSVAYQVYSSTSTFTHTEYVSDSSSSAYPEAGTSGGYYYKRLGQIGSALDGGAKSEVVSHVGTGTYGSSNPTIIPFSFVPKIIFVAMSSDIIDDYDVYMYPSNQLAGEYLSPFLLTDEYTEVHLPPVFGNSTYVYAKMDGTTLYVYASSSQIQMNSSGATVYFIAVG